MDATYNVMLDAKKNDYKNILILEEDFIVNNNEITNKNIENIKNTKNTNLFLRFVFFVSTENEVFRLLKYKNI